jgi:hypothetical protein
VFRGPPHACVFRSSPPHPARTIAEAITMTRTRTLFTPTQTLELGESSARRRPSASVPDRHAGRGVQEATIRRLPRRDASAGPADRRERQRLSHGPRQVTPPNLSSGRLSPASLTTLGGPAHNLRTGEEQEETHTTPSSPSMLRSAARNTRPSSRSEPRAPREARPPFSCGIHGALAIQLRPASAQVVSGR